MPSPIRDFEVMPGPDHDRLLAQLRIVREQPARLACGSELVHSDWSAFCPKCSAAEQGALDKARLLRDAGALPTFANSAEICAAMLSAPSDSIHPIGYRAR